MYWWLVVVQLLGCGAAPSFHFGPGNGLAPGRMGDPQLYWDAPSRRFHIFPQFSPADCQRGQAPDGWGHAASTDLVADFAPYAAPFGPCAVSRLDLYSAAGTGCTIRINASHVGSLVNGDTTVGWETTNNYAAVVDSRVDSRLVRWSQVSHGIEGNHSVGETGWVGTPGNHIPPPFGLIGNVVAYHNASAIMALVSSSVGNPRLPSSTPAFLLYSSTDFARWRYLGPLYVHNQPMNRAECGDFFPIGPGSLNVTSENVDFGQAAADSWWVLMWSRPERNGGGLSRDAGVVYLIGKLGPDGEFVPKSALQAADYGSGYYASQTVLGPPEMGGRIIMADLGGGVQSLPRSVTLNQDDLSLNFQPTPALARRWAARPVIVANLSVAANGSQSLEGIGPLVSALDIKVTVRAAAGSTGCGLWLKATSPEDRGLVLTVQLTGDASARRPIHQLTIQQDPNKPPVSVPVAARLESEDSSAAGLRAQAQFRVVVDGDVVEIFTGLTPVSFMFGGQGTGAGLFTGAADAEFDVVAHGVKPSTIINNATLEART